MGDEEQHGEQPARDEKGRDREEFPVVGVGASAGGLEALKELLGRMRSGTGAAFVVVTHQHPEHVSLLPELLARQTALRVVEAAHGMRVAPEHVYVGPPGSNLELLDGVLLNPVRRAGKSPPLPIDRFFRSLAAERRERAICIVLSGTGTDGTLGSKAVKAEGGMVMVQRPESAQYSGMPASVVSAGMADFVFEPADMPEQLAEYLRGPYLVREAGVEQGPVISDDILQRAMAMLQERNRHDFSRYKTNTIRRRLARRMNIHRIAEPQDYLRYLQENAHELDLLFKELLINVTNFFRDPEVWESLARGPLRDLLEALPEGHTLRAWVPGCTSGEESYTLAIVLRECMDRLGRHFSTQIFGTDLDAESIDAARAGVYPEGIAADVTPERLERWFTAEDKTFRVRSEIREMVTFALQNVISDPPFTKLDVLSCRNLLIYLTACLQKELMPVFHFALRPGGLLVLGTSEAVGDHTVLFEPLDNKRKIFRARDVPCRVGGKERKGMADGTVGAPAPAMGEAGKPGEQRQFSRLVDKAMFARFCPPSVVITDRGEILHVYGRTGRFLEPAEGEARLNVFDMAREGLSLALTGALRRAQAGCKPVRRPRVRVKIDGTETLVDLAVIPFDEPASLRGLFLVTFEEPPPRPPAEASSEDGKPESEDGGRIADLERELQESRENQQSTTEELETTNEELKSANEELQSTNEELESSKEELQSLNEELSTVNTQLQSKVDQLSQAYDDMQNLLDNTRVATLFLDTDLKIVRFTEHARELIRLAPGDVGRPVGDIVSRFDYEHLEDDCRVVLRTLESKEIEVEVKGGTTYLMRIGPYRSTRNVIKGLVMTFVRAGELRAYFESIVQTVRHPLVVLDGDLRVVSANRAFLWVFDLRSGAIVHTPLYEIAEGAWDVPKLRRLLEEILPRDTTFEDFDLDLVDPRSGRKRTFMLNARRLRRAEGKTGMILLACEEV